MTMADRIPLLSKSLFMRLYFPAWNDGEKLPGCIDSFFFFLGEVKGLSSGFRGNICQSLMPLSIPGSMVVVICHFFTSAYKPGAIFGLFLLSCCCLRRCDSEDLQDLQCNTSDTRFTVCEETEVESISFPCGVRPPFPILLRLRCFLSCVCAKQIRSHIC